MNNADFYVSKFTSLVHMLEVLNTETVCREYLENLRWEGNPVCPHCGSVNKDHYKLKANGEFNGLYKCKDCRSRFTVRVGTMFEGSHVPLRKWFIAIYIFTSHKKGISSLQLHRDLGITQKTAWFMLGRLRHTFKNHPEEKITGIVQADETFVGGKNKNRHANKRIKGSQGRSTKYKTPVFGLISNGNVYTQVVENTKAKTLVPIIKQKVEKDAIMVTDEWGAYKRLSKYYHHEHMNHSRGEYVNDEGFHTNSIEGFWSHLKRGITGIYHWVSKKHLQKYCDEFSYRYNTRNMPDGERFSFTLLNANDRITYAELIRKA